MASCKKVVFSLDLENLEMRFKGILENVGTQPTEVLCRGRRNALGWLRDVSAVAAGLEKVSFHSNPKEVKWSRSVVADSLRPREL